MEGLNQTHRSRRCFKNCVVLSQLSVPLPFETSQFWPPRTPVLRIATSNTYCFACWVGFESRAAPSGPLVLDVRWIRPNVLLLGLSQNHSGHPTVFTASIHHLYPSVDQYELNRWRNSLRRGGAWGYLSSLGKQSPCFALAGKKMWITSIFEVEGGIEPFKWIANFAVPLKLQREE